jgi:ABC-type branched-subunit amino acid transport system substrate-binding protein
LVAACIGLVACSSDSKSADTTAAPATTAAAGDDTATPAASTESSAASTESSAATGATTGSSEAASDFSAIPDGPIKIGVSLSLTGPLAGSGAFFKQVYESVTLAAFNARYPDGIDGHEVVLDIQDDGSDPTTGASVAKGFVDDGVVAVMHLSDTPEVRDIQAAILNDAHVPMISYATSTALENTEDYPYNFGTSIAPSLNKKAEIAFFKAHQEIKKIAILTDNSPLVEQDLDTLHSLADDGTFSIAATAEVNTTTLDFGTAVAQLKDADADLVVILTTGAYGNIWKAILAASWTPEVLTQSYALFNGYADMGDLAPHVRVLTSGCVSSADEKFSPEVTDLMDQYSTATGGASPSLLVYVQTNDVGVELLKTAVEKYHSVDPDAIRQALEGFSGDVLFPGNTYEFSPTDHYGLTGTYGAQVCNAAPLVGGKYLLPTITK